jgi:hypothetical protein
MRLLKALLLLTPCMAGACATSRPNPNVQPQAVAGPCTVKPFFVVPLRPTPTEMEIENTGQSCSISIFNADLGAAQDGALISTRPQHGQVTTQLLGGERGTTVVVYTPNAAYAGPDLFDITFEPGARDVVFHVTVKPPVRPAG